jgi:hypothetical protein
MSIACKGIMSKYLPILFILFLLISCKRIKNDSNTKNPLVSKNEANHIPTYLNVVDTKTKIYKRREDIDNFIHDTITSIQEKFKRIFGEYLINKKNFELSFLKNSDLYQSHQPDFIDSYDNLMDSIRKGKIDLDSRSVKLMEGDTLILVLKYKNDNIDTIKWKKDDWGGYCFKGYFTKNRYYWIQQSDHGTADYYINADDGKILNFLPNYSSRKSFYCDMKSEETYGDGQSLKFVLGKDLKTPLVNIEFEYAPLLKNSTHIAEFSFDHIFWLNDKELLFRFNHLLKKHLDSPDTLFYDKVGIKIRMY